MRSASLDPVVALLVTIYNSDAMSFTLSPEASQVFGDLGVAVEFELEGQVEPS